MKTFEMLFLPTMPNIQINILPTIYATGLKDITDETYNEVERATGEKGSMKNSNWTRVSAENFEAV